MYPEDSTHFLSSEEDAKEMVNIDTWVKKFADPKSVYECLEILPDSTKPRWWVTDDVDCLLFYCFFSTTI